MSPLFFNSISAEWTIILSMHECPFPQFRPAGDDAEPGPDVPCGFAGDAARLGLVRQPRPRAPLPHRPHVQRQHGDRRRRRVRKDVRGKEDFNL